jgi:nicotinate-nucleotide adenylyltransferase
MAITRSNKLANAYKDEASSGTERVALYGGSFDPVHSAHLRIAQSVIESGVVDRLIFVPTAHSPLKKDGPIASDSQRLQMLALATADEPRYSVDSSEIEQGGISYTIDWVRSFKAAHPNAQLYWILGADQFELLEQWRSIRELAQLLHFLVLPRPKHALVAPSIPGLNYQIVDAPLLSESSTAIREACEQGIAITDRVPKSVEAFISQQSLYK